MKRKRVIPRLLAVLGVPLIRRIAATRYRRIGEAWDVAEAEGEELKRLIRTYHRSIGRMHRVQFLVGESLFERLLALTKKQAVMLGSFADRGPECEGMQWRGVPIVLDSFLGQNQIQMAELIN